MGGKLKDGGVGAATEQAKSDYTRKQVSRILHKRIPIMAHDSQEDEEERGDADDRADGPEEGAAPGTASKVHDTVLVSYVNFQLTQDAKCEDYKVTFRIDNETTVGALHK